MTYSKSCCLFIFCAMQLIISISLLAQSFSTIPSLNSNDIRIQVANDDELQNYILKVNHDSSELCQISITKGRIDGKSPWGLVYADYEIKTHRLTKTAKKYCGYFNINGDIAEYSPDSSFIFIGVNHPSYIPPGFINKAYIFNALTKASLDVISLDEDMYIEDFTWSKDNMYLVMLIEQRNIRYSLRGLFFLLAGHPIPLYSYYFKIFNLKTNTINDIILVKNIEDGIASFVNK